MILYFGFLGLIYLIIPLPNPLFSPDYSTAVLDEEGKILRIFLNKSEQWCFSPNQILTVPEKLKKSVICFEDQQFYYHPGFNPFSLLRASFQNIISGKIVSGASTITMQIARLIRPKPRTVINKILELMQSVKIELKYTKNDILRLYLDHAPYGGNVIGFQAASLRYFQKIPDQLTWGEAALLAVLPNAPGLIAPGSNQKQLINKRNRLLKTLLKKQIIDLEGFRLALLEEVPDSSKPGRMAAPHLAQFLKTQNRGRTSVIHTFLKKDLQLQVEELVRQNSAYLAGQGIANSSALVIETQSGKVRAYVGSQDFFDQENKGQVDGVRAPRSSGSLLKPFLYGLSFDEGLVLPETQMKDVPSFYGAFSPSNSDHKFNGMVYARDALIRSLNVPAVRLLYSYGIYRFYSFLKSARLSTIFRPVDDYGLPLIIGGAEVTLWDMARLFRGLARRGRFEPLLITEEAASRNAGNLTASLISPGACSLTLNILRNLKRPGAEYYWQQYQNQKPIAWKTGTSYGQRDAWAVGVCPQWTIAVWVGNFSGEGNSNLSGSGSAGPLLFDIFNSLPKNPELNWFEEQIGDLAPVEICSTTGFLAGEYCREKILVEAPRHMKSLKICPYHRNIYVDSNLTHQVCSLCWQPDNYHQVIGLIYPPDVAQYLRERGQVSSSLPPHDPSCPAAAEDLPLQILYPQPDARLWIPRDFGSDLQKITLRAAHSEKNRILYWYLDDRYMGKSKDRHTKAVKFLEGWHVLEVVDENGNRDRRRFHVDLKK